MKMKDRRHRVGSVSSSETDNGPMKSGVGCGATLPDYIFNK